MKFEAPFMNIFSPFLVAASVFIVAPCENTLCVHRNGFAMVPYTAHGVIFFGDLIFKFGIFYKFIRGIALFLFIQPPNERIDFLSSGLIASLIIVIFANK